MTMTGKELLQLMLKKGWKLIRIDGSHHIIRKGEQIEVIPVHGNKDLPKGLLNAILKRNGISI
ncbi:MAG: type II toxin-antitoxin system HicA family toxin [Lachnospiraceae bacterium]|nr:type II toxin-antitoxin system HicA family toxin [Lachnospiraceae bacterium]